MKKVLFVLMMLPLFTACTERTLFEVECKDNVLHYTYTKSYVETGTTLRKVTGILTYKDDTIVKCNY